MSLPFDFSTKIDVGSPREAMIDLYALKQDFGEGNSNAGEDPERGVAAQESMYVEAIPFSIGTR